MYSMNLQNIFCLYHKISADFTVKQYFAACLLLLFAFTHSFSLFIYSLQHSSAVIWQKVMFLNLLYCHLFLFDKGTTEHFFQFCLKAILFIYKYELMLGLLVFCQTGPPRRVDCLPPPALHFLPHEDGGISSSLLSKDKTSKFSPHHPNVLSAKQRSCKYHFLKSFGITRLEE